MTNPDRCFHCVHSLGQGPIGATVQRSAVRPRRAHVSIVSFAYRKGMSSKTTARGESIQRAARFITPERFRRPSRIKGETPAMMVAATTRATANQKVCAPITAPNVNISCCSSVCAASISAPHIHLPTGNPMMTPIKQNHKFSCVTSHVISAHCRNQTKTLWPALCISRASRALSHFILRNVGDPPLEAGLLDMVSARRYLTFAEARAQATAQSAARILSSLILPGGQRVDAASGETVE